MTGMQRLVTYIYAYEGSQKIGNTGYAKIEIRGNSGWMEVHISIKEMISGEAEIRFLHIENDNIEKIPLGILPLENGRGVGKYTFHTGMLLDTKVSFEKTIGIEIADNSGNRYMSFWKDVDPLLLMQKNEQEKNEKKHNAVENKKDTINELVKEKEESEIRNIKETEEVFQKNISAESEKKEQWKDAEQESLHTLEIPMRNVFTNYTIEDVWNSFRKRKNCVQINKDVWAVQIELSDLRELPKRYWYLGNNSFLLHGFFNYRHLLFGSLKEGEWFIGVPGVYERQERVMASIFGFPGFLYLKESKESEKMSDQQMPPLEIRQGIWYHILES